MWDFQHFFLLKKSHLGENKAILCWLHSWLAALVNWPLLTWDYLTTSNSEQTQPGLGMHWPKALLLSYLPANERKTISYFWDEPFVTECLHALYVWSVYPVHNESMLYNIMHPLVQNECCCGICANNRSNFSYKNYINISVWYTLSVPIIVHFSFVLGQASLRLTKFWENTC